MMIRKAHHTIINFLKNSPIGEVTHSFYRPSDLMNDIHAIGMDVVFLDILFMNDTMQGFDLAPVLTAEHKIVIFGEFG